MTVTTFSGLWDELKADAAAAVQELEQGAVALEGKIVPIIEAEIVATLSQFKQLAISTVISLAGTAGAAMTGQEKLGTVVTTIIQDAETKGVQIAVGNAQALGQQAFNAVASQLGGQ